MACSCGCTGLLGYLSFFLSIISVDEASPGAQTEAEGEAEDKDEEGAVRDMAEDPPARGAAEEELATGPGAGPDVNEAADPDLVSGPSEAVVLSETSLDTPCLAFWLGCCDCGCGC